MPIIPAQDTDVAIEEGRWRIYVKTDKLKAPLLFEILKSSGVITYLPEFAKSVGLPGDRLSTRYVQSVVVGYDPKNLQWQLGLHIADEPTEKPRWIPLVKWEKAPNQQFADDAQHSGRVLAEYVGCPLKIFGVKKSTQTQITGPLEQHYRVEVERRKINDMASTVKLPLEYFDTFLGPGRNDGLTLRIGRQSVASERGIVAPAYQLCDIDPKKETLKLVPPTSLLGTFFSGVRGREIPFANIRNLELRYVIENISATRPENDNENMLTEVFTTYRSWQIYLTLRDETILLVMTTHSISSDLTRQRVKVSARDTAYHLNVNYYRQLEENQRKRDEAEHWATAASYVIASVIKCRLVQTQVGSEIE